jgi:hypothetical protein
MERILIHSLAPIKSTTIINEEDNYIKLNIILIKILIKYKEKENLEIPNGPPRPASPPFLRS